ncbi:MAG: aspartate 1-decarboxylase [Thermaerobacter sp.]|nr:aspartate 1-decarboxylase [Thermaerobacter sp.]MDA8145941.1 aspartate 1-decarboxylase [Thermaerobacter sp.]
MWRMMFKGKIHRARVTEANLNYMGSITVDAELLAAADILPHEQVQVVNLHTGQRFETYAVPGEPGSGTVCLNGGTARMGQPGDIVLIISYGLCSPEELREFRPRVVMVDEHNRPLKADR